MNQNFITAVPTGAHYCFLPPLLKISPWARIHAQYLAQECEDYGEDMSSRQRRRNQAPFDLNITAGQRVIYSQLKPGRGKSETRTEVPCTVGDISTREVTLQPEDGSGEIIITSKTMASNISIDGGGSIGPNGLSKEESECSSSSSSSSSSSIGSIAACASAGSNEDDGSGSGSLMKT